MLLFNIVPLLGALALLWVPSQPFYADSVRRRIISSYGSNGFPILQMLPLWHNWADFLRGAAGAYLLFHHAFAMDPEFQERYFWGLGIIALVLALGVLINTIYYRNGVYCLSPAFYLCGVSLFVTDWWVALYGIAGGVLLGKMFNSTELFFLTMAAVVGVLGYFLAAGIGDLVHVAVACLLIALPVFVVLAVQEDLKTPVRRGSFVEEDVD